jgi:hypothetical protein
MNAKPVKNCATGYHASGDNPAEISSKTPTLAQPFAII